MAPHPPTPHSWLEDLQALLVGCLLVALAVCLFREAGLFTGGTTGVAFLIHYVWGWPLAGLLAGTGILILIRHGASLGGVTIMAVYLQKTRGWRAGHVQMAVDGVILLAALAVTTPLRVLLSLVGALALNLVIGVNHRADRYYGV